MIISFKEVGVADIFNGKKTKAARTTCPMTLWKVARRKLFQLNVAKVLDDLRVPPGNRLESLKGSREGQHSIRINDQYRLGFVWTKDGPGSDAIWVRFDNFSKVVKSVQRVPSHPHCMTTDGPNQVEIVDYHS
jgi:proteic killer suppression protein